MKWPLSVMLIFSLMSSDLPLSNLQNQLIDEKWFLIESKPNANFLQFTKKDVSAKSEDFKASLKFKENGILIERHDSETAEPFYISGWVINNSKAELEISNSRHWNGFYKIDHIDNQTLRLIKK